MRTEQILTGVAPSRGTRTVSERAESRAATSALIAFFAVAVCCVAMMWGQRLPLAGAGSVGTYAAWTTAVATGFAVVFASVAARRSGHAAWRQDLPKAKRAVDLVAIVAAVAALSALAIEAVAHLFQEAFVGLTLDPLGGGALAGAAAAPLTYFASVFGSRVTTRGLALLATSTLFVSTMASMLSATDARWWELHFSQLGNLSGGSAAVFNLGLILAGLVVVAAANYAGRDVWRGVHLHRADAELSDDPTEALTADDPERRIARRARTATGLFIAIGLLLCVTGLVHDAVNTAVHVGAASGMVVMFGALAVFALVALPGFPNGFRTLTVGVLIGILIAILLWIPIGYYNLTGVEFIAAGLIFAWFILFTRTLSAFAGRG